MSSPVPIPDLHTVAGTRSGEEAGGLCDVTSVLTGSTVTQLLLRRDHGRAPCRPLAPCSGRAGTWWRAEGGRADP